MLWLHIKERHPDVKKVEYITDGSAAQYKNYKVWLTWATTRKILGLKRRGAFTLLATESAHVTPLEAVSKEL
jgi:hypothetical protein